MNGTGLAGHATFDFNPHFELIAESGDVLVTVYQVWKINAATEKLARIMKLIVNQRHLCTRSRWLIIGIIMIVNCFTEKHQIGMFVKLLT